MSYDVELSKIADLVNKFRVVPRLILVGYAYMLWDIVKWLKLLESPTLEQASILATVIGIAGLIVTSYQNTGNK